MLTSKDTEVNILGWNLFVNEYEKTIMKRIRLHHYPQLTNASEAIIFLTNSIIPSVKMYIKYVHYISISPYLDTQICAGG